MNLLQLYPRKGMGFHRRILQNEHHLKQRGMAHIAVQLQGIHNHLEGDVLVLVRLQGYIFHPLQQFAEGRIVGKVRSQDQGVNKQPDNVFQFLLPAIGNRGSHTNVILPGIAVQQHLKGRHQQHEHGDSFLAGQVFQTARQFG